MQLPSTFANPHAEKRPGLGDTAQEREMLARIKAEYEAHRGEHEAVEAATT